MMRAVVWLAVVVLLGSYICGNVADPDLWWHITVGKWIIAHKQIPHQDLWNMFGAGQPWRAYSWSNEIVVALVDRWFGAAGLATMQLCLAIALAGALALAYGKLARNHFIGALLGGYATLACFNHFTLRPQVIVWILFALVLVVSDQLVERGVTPRRLAWLAVLGCVWANSHLTAVLGVVGIALWGVQWEGQRRQWREAAQGTAAFVLGTVCTPYLGGEWLTFLSKGGHPLKYSMIAEFQPATILQFSTVFVVLLCAVVLVIAYSSRCLPTLGRAVLAGGMTLAGLTATKFLPFAAITLCALIAVQQRIVVARVRNAAGDADTAAGMHDNLLEGLRLLQEKFQRLASETLGAIAFFAVSIAAVNINQIAQHPLNLRIVPKQPVDFIEQHNLAHPILNEFGSGGYLMYRFSAADGEPLKRVAIDGRTNVNPPEVWEMYARSFNGRRGWHEFIDKVKPNTILWRRGSAMATLLAQSKEWCEVYSNGDGEEDFVVFSRALSGDKGAGEGRCGGGA